MTSKVSLIPIAEGSFISSDFNFNTSPVVVVCGWLNGPAKPVQKYATLYTDLGYRVLVLQSFNSHWWNPFVSPHKTTFNAINKLLNLETNQLNQQIHWIPHLMSNGGTKTWTTFESYFKSKLNVQAMMFDSCPSIYNPKTSFKLTAFYAHMKPLTKTIISILVKPIEFVLWFFPFKGFERVEKKLIDEHKEVPKLFLYSKVDQMVRSSDIEETIRRAKAFGTLVESIDFLDSPHVAHYMTHKNAYRDAIVQFLNTHK
ncbi:hypothetical protein BC833DRAFT_576727 [Globomyces pollinis-pini]|nr:hypothetical protein BC833DRAFT_576727 [Globomyces pollinis-pini]KAJ2998504.1 hypothetical protein HDV02_004512 [Globomyces sp. JEL0801]